MILLESSANTYVCTLSIIYICTYLQDILPNHYISVVLTTMYSDYQHKMNAIDLMENNVITVYVFTTLNI